VVNTSTSKIAVLGHFADGSERVDGQILRTRIAREELCRRLGEDRVVWADTGFLKRHPIRSLVRIGRAMKRADALVVLPGPRGLSVLMPWYVWWKRRTGGGVHYLVIGGWLPRHLKAHPRQVARVRACDGVYVQTRRMNRELAELGLERVRLLPNVRRFCRNRSVSGAVGDRLRLVFLSRVMEAKGLEVAVEAVRAINAAAAEPKVGLTIYGQVQAGEEAWFERVRNRFTPEIRFEGGLKPEEVNDRLIQHDVMVFPTWYPGEGFPGVLIDAMVAGIPVLASDWRDNAEFVREGETGWLCEVGSMESLRERIEWMREHPEKVEAMKRASADAADAYHVDAVWPALLERMKLVDPQDGEEQFQTTDQSLGHGEELETR